MTMTPEFALNITRKLGLDEELPAALLKQPRGIVPCDLYSLEDFYYLVRGGSDTLPSFNFTLLDQWLTDVICDAELAQQIAAIEAQDIAYIEKCKLVAPVVEARLNEARAVLHPEDEAAEDEQEIQVVQNFDPKASESEV